GERSRQAGLAVTELGETATHVLQSGVERRGAVGDLVCAAGENDRAVRELARTCSGSLRAGGKLTCAVGNLAGTVRDLCATGGEPLGVGQLRADTVTQLLGAVVDLRDATGELRSTAGGLATEPGLQRVRTIGELRQTGQQLPGPVTELEQVGVDLA